MKFFKFVTIATMSFSVSSFAQSASTPATPPADEGGKAYIANIATILKDSGFSFEQGASASLDTQQKDSENGQFHSLDMHPVQVSVSEKTKDYTELDIDGFKTRIANSALTPDLQMPAFQKPKDEKLHPWKAIGEAELFNGAMNAVRLSEDKTRKEIKAPFFSRWGDAIAGGNYKKWDDGGKFFTNYVAHPMEGAIFGQIWCQNDPKCKSVEFGLNKTYGKALLRSTAFSAAYSTRFELGCPGEACLGHVTGDQATWGDLIVTPVAGAAWKVGSDAYSKYVINKTNNKNAFVRVAVRLAPINIDKLVGNAMRFKNPFSRDSNGAQ